MIQLNHEPHPWNKPLSVTELMAEKGYVFQDIVVKINGTIIREERWKETYIQDNDDVEMIHIFGGG